MTSPNAELAGLRVLTVEDRYLIAVELAEQVGKLGGEVLGPVADLGAAAEAIGERAPDMALLDVNLESELVFPLAEELERRATPFAFLTGYDGDILPERWRLRPRLLKPVNPRHLRTQLLAFAAR